jgi:hypothetical protein
VAQLEVWDVTAPAGTTTTNPLEVVTVTPGLWTVVACTVVIPDGHAYTTGIALGFGHQQVVPRNPGAYISGDGEPYNIDLIGYPAGVPWSVFLVNTDTQAHSWETRWVLEEVSQQQASAVPQPIPASQIYGIVVPVGAG